jgi:hypothetical protein
MSAVTVYRILLLIRGCWSLLEWFFGWVQTDTSKRLSELNPYLPLLVGALGEALFLGLLAALCFFRPWARWLFVVLIALGLIIFVVRPHHLVSAPPSFVLVIYWFMVMLNGAIVAMSFLPPVREMYDSNLTKR